MRRNRLALLFVLFIAQAALAVPLAITTLGVSTSTPTTAVITWTTTGTSAAADTRVSYTGGGVTNTYIDGARVTSHSATLIGLQPGVVYTYTASSQSATETATGTAATFSLCQPNSGKLTAVKATLYSFYAYGAFTATWHDLSGIGTTPTQCGVAITTPVSGTLDINGNLSVALPDVNQVTPSVGAWTIAFSSFASTGSVSVDISPTGQNFDASVTIQAQVTSGNKGPVGGSSGAGTGTVTSVTFTGDGVVDSSTPSAAVTTSGTVTGTIKTQTAHTFLGNNTGSTAAPTFASLALADLPGTVVNATSPGAGIAHFAGSTQTVTSSAIVAADIASGTITGTQLSSSAALPNGVTATTQSVSDNSTKVATTAYADRVAAAGVPALGKWLCGNHADGAGATWTCVSRANVASGDVLIAACSGFLNDSGAATTTVADTLTTTWTRIGSEYFESTPSTIHFTAFKGTAASSGADTLTCTSTNAATSFTGSFLGTVLGSSAVDVAPTGNSGTNGHADSTQLTTTAANDLCFQWLAGSTITGGGGTTLVYNAGNGYGMAMSRVGAAGNYVLTTEVSSNFGNFSFCLK